VDPSATECGQKEQVTGKFFDTPPGIKPSISCLVVQCLNQLCHRMPTEIYNTNEFSIETNLSVEFRGELGYYGWLEGLGY